MASPRDSVQGMSGVEHLDIIISSLSGSIDDGASSVCVGGLDRIGKRQVRSRSGRVAEIFDFKVDDLIAVDCQRKRLAIQSEKSSLRCARIREINVQSRLRSLRSVSYA